MEPFLNTMTWNGRLLTAAHDALRVLAQFIPADTLFVALNDDRTNTILRACNRHEPLVAEQTAFPAETSYCRLVRANGLQPTIIPDTARFPGTMPIGPERAKGSYSFIGVPITLDSPRGMVGTVCALSKRHHVYTPSEADLLLAMAGLLAHVIGLELAAVTDPLTGLYTRAYLDMLQSQSNPIRYPYGILVLDIDGFRRVNERCGHAAGDALLRGYAALIRDTLPGATHIRLYGDKFLTLLQGISAEKLREAAAHAGGRLAGLAAEYEAGQRVCATVSVGAAHASDLDADLDALIRRAEGRAAQAKAAAKAAAYERMEGGYGRGGADAL